MPYALSKSGIIAGPIGLVIIGFLTDRCCNILCRCKQKALNRIIHRGCRVPYEDLFRVITYGGIAMEAFGPWAERIVSIALAFTQFGFCIQYFIFVVTSLRVFIPSASTIELASIPFIFLAPCALLPSARALAPVSALANAALLIGFIGCLIYEISSILQPAKVPLCNWREFPIFFSIAMSCYEGIGTVLPVEATVRFCFFFILTSA